MANTPQGRTQAADTPRLVGGDSLTIESVAHPFNFERHVPAELAARIVDAINRMGGAGDEAETCYQRAVDGLARHAKKVTQALVAEYSGLPENLYLDRWALVQLMAELKHESALEFVDALLSKRLNQGEGAQGDALPEDINPLGEEVMIRTTAVDAAARMAEDGSARALEVLLRHVGHENFSVKRAAIQGYLAHGGEQARDLLSKAVAERDHHIMDIQRIDVHQAPQAQGGLYLKSSDGKDNLPGHDLGRGDGSGHSDPHKDDKCGC
jgi:hypothetical protein